MAAKKETKQIEKKPEEKQFTISLTPVFKNPRPKRAFRAINFIRKFMFKHFRVKAENVSISQELNEAVWAKGREHIPRKIEVKVIKEKDKANVYLKDEKVAVKKEKKKEKSAEKEKTEEEVAEIEKKQKDKKTVEKAAETTQIKRGGK